MNKEEKSKSAQGHRSYRIDGSSEIIEAARMVKKWSFQHLQGCEGKKGVPWRSLKRFLAENEEVTKASMLKKLGHPFAVEPELEQK